MLLKPSSMNGIKQNEHPQKIRYTPWNFDSYQLKTFHGLKWHFSRKNKSTMATKKSGNFRNYIESEKNISFKDFSNPFTFYNLMFKESTLLFVGYKTEVYFVIMLFVKTAITNDDYCKRRQHGWVCFSL